MTLSDAKPCPWCGGTSISLKQLHYYCADCGARGPQSRGTKAAAIRLWNSRTDEKRVALAMLSALHPSSVHCRQSEAECRGEDYCICQCKLCREAWSCGAWYELRKRIESGDVPGTVAK